MLLKPPVMQGVIRRRLLVNFRVDPEVMQRHVPKPFTPQVHNGYAVAGICLIRLEQMRPRGISVPVGLASENAAHRVAVCWTDSGGSPGQGVFIPRRDTNSIASHLAGGRIFPGEHHLASFNVDHIADTIALRMQSADGAVMVNVSGQVADALPPTSIFASLEQASDFFERGSVGYSACLSGSHFDGLQLHTAGWQVRPLAVNHVASSYFDNQAMFPEGSATFDCALIMEHTEHNWTPLSPWRRDREVATWLTSGPSASRSGWSTPTC